MGRDRGTHGSSRMRALWPVLLAAAWLFTQLMVRPSLARADLPPEWLGQRVTSVQVVGDPSSSRAQRPLC